MFLVALAVTLVVGALAVRRAEAGPWACCEPAQYTTTIVSGCTQTQFCENSTCTVEKGYTIAGGCQFYPNPFAGCSPESLYVKITVQNIGCPLTPYGYCDPCDPNEYIVSETFRYQWTASCVGFGCP